MKKRFPPGLLFAASSAFALAAFAGEEPVNGCLAADAIDLTGAGANVVISATFDVPALKRLLDPTRMCLRIRPDQKITIQGTHVVGGPLMVGGTVDGDGVATYNKDSPIQPSCYNARTFNPNGKGCYSGGVWPCTYATCKAFANGAYGFYNNSKNTQRGALFVGP